LVFGTSAADGNEEFVVSHKKPGLFGSLAIIAMSLAFLGAGYQVRKTMQPYPDGLSATATLTGARQYKDDDGNTVYSAVYTFTTQGGREVSFNEPFSSGQRPNIGDKAKVSYRPADPEAARVIGKHAWFGVAFMIGGGLGVLLGIGYFLYRVLVVSVGLTMFGIGLRDRRAARRAASRPASPPAVPFSPLPDVPLISPHIDGPGTSSPR
jgi:hypothetical protein